jgi:intracellular septation protein A
LAITPKTTSEILYKPIKSRIDVAFDPYLFRKSKTGFAYAFFADSLLINFILIKKNIIKANVKKQKTILINSFRKLTIGSLL